MIIWPSQSQEVEGKTHSIALVGKQFGEDLDWNLWRATHRPEGTTNPAQFFFPVANRLEGLLLCLIQHAVLSTSTSISVRIKQRKRPPVYRQSVLRAH